MTKQTPRPKSSRRGDTPPPKTGTDELSVLVGFLDYLRESVIAKTEGVAEPAIRTPQVQSGTNLLGLVKHLTHVERRMFRGADVTDWPATFTADDDETAADIIAAYRTAIDEANAALHGRTDLATGVDGAEKSTPTLRWALVHMIEETGRHAGHVDIIRELIDGRTGR